MEQTGLFRYRPEEYTKYQEEFKLAIQDITGVPVAVQEEIDKQYPTTGKRFADYYHLDVYQQKLIYSYETFRQWQGVATPLTPSSYKDMELKILNYYDEVDKLQSQYRHTTQYDSAGKLLSYSVADINQQLVDGDISPSQWVSARNDLVGKLFTAQQTLGNSLPYADVPKTLADREAYMKQKGVVVPVLAPDQELLNYYYDLKPEYKMNQESGKMELDFDTYYAYVDNLLSSMDQDYKDRLLQRIQFDWTGLEKLYWQTSRDYIRPYNAVSDVVKSTFDEKGQYWINRYSSADTVEKQQIDSFDLAPGVGLMSEYRKQLASAHESMRLADPELDAWLNFWGKVSSFKTPEAEQKYTAMRKQYLTASMAK